MENCMISVVGKGSETFMSKGSGGTRLVCKDLPVDTLQKNLAEFIDRLGTSLECVQSRISNYDLDEIEINIEVSATGSISLVGSVEAGATGGITLRFKRCSHG